MKGKHKKGGDGWSPVIHYEVSGAGRIDYQYNPAYQTSSSADEHAVVRMLVIDSGQSLAPMVECPCGRVRMPRCARNRWAWAR
jgi:hypothetical protein